MLSRGNRYERVRPRRQTDRRESLGCVMGIEKWPSAIRVSDRRRWRGEGGEQGKENRSVV